MAQQKRCRSGTITFKSKRGKVISFKGRHGADCGPRKKPSTRHLSVYKKAFARAAKSCSKRGGMKAFRKCIGTAVRNAG